MVEREGGQVHLPGVEGVGQLGDAQREDGVHVVLQPPALKGFAGVAGLDRVAEVVQEWVEVVVRDHEDAGVGVGLVVGFEFRRHLKAQGGLAAPLLAEDQRRRGVARAAEEFVPGRVVDLVEAGSLEDRVGLGVFLAERVAGDPMMLQELINLHPDDAFPEPLSQNRPSVLPDRAANLNQTGGATPDPLATFGWANPRRAGGVSPLSSFLDRQKQGVNTPRSPGKRSHWWALAALAILGLAGCSEAKPEPLRVAAASDLRSGLPILIAAFRQDHPGEVEPVFGASGELAEQIRQGAPFDLFLAANEKFVARLATEKVIDPATVRPYARGTLVMAINPVFDHHPKTLRDLLDPKIKSIAIANTETAPYGIVAKQALERQGLWDEVKPRLAVAGSVAQALEMVRSGNAEVGFVGKSLADSPGLEFVPVPAEAHDPIIQYLGVVARSGRSAEARAFADFLVGKTGQGMLRDLNFAPVPTEPAPAQP